MTKKYAVAITHDGKFHADDVFAAAMLPYCDFPAMTIHRVRPNTEINKILLENAFIVWDVGMVYDHATKRYDHHMRDNAPVRDDGAKYSSAGLIFYHYGKEIIKNIMGYGGDFVEFVYNELHNRFILHLDNVDNGAKKVGGSDITAIIGDFNIYGDDGFWKAVKLADQVLYMKIAQLVKIFESQEKVLNAAKNLYLGHILVLDEGIPYKHVIFDHDMVNVLFCVFPADQEWRVSTIPSEPGSMEHRVSLPANWGGLEGADLAFVSGVNDAIFVHKALFVGGAKSKEGALKMAALAFHQHQLLEYFVQHMK